MNTVLKVCLKKVLRYKDPKIAEGYVEPLGVKTHEDIINELYAEGKIVDKELARHIIDSYNKKAAEMTMSGYVVYTGLVKLVAAMRGLVYDRRWSRLGNKVDVQFEIDVVLAEAIKNTTVELDLSKSPEIDEEEFSDDCNGSQTYIPTFRLGESKILTEKEPACGIVFRQWLCKSI